MIVALTGATGTLGRALARALIERGAEVRALSRTGERARAALGGAVIAHEWRDPLAEPPPAEALSGADAVVHLLGEPVAQRWTEAARGRIRDSRVLSTRNLVRALARIPDPPRALVSQSATGYYGPRGEEPVDETESPGSDFLAQVCVAWEAEARVAEASGVRVAITRTGVVLSPSGGALERMLPPFRLGVGGPVAGGAQQVPWVDLDDVVGALLLCVDRPDVRGPVNVTSPRPVTNRELSRALGRVLRRPAVLPVPALALRLLYGDMAMIVTTGVRAVPAALDRHGYRFTEPDLERALRRALSA